MATRLSLETPPAAPTWPRSPGRGDRLLLAAVCSAAAVVAIGAHDGSLILTLGVSALLPCSGAAAYLLARGSALSCIVLTTCNVALVALHIQLGRGTTEFHFGVFVLLGLGLVLVYRDWRQATRRSWPCRRAMRPSMASSPP